MFLQHVLNEALKRLFEKNGASSATNSLSIIEYWRQVSHGTFFFFFQHIFDLWIICLGDIIRKNYSKIIKRDKVFLVITSNSLQWNFYPE